MTTVDVPINYTQWIQEDGMPAPYFYQFINDFWRRSGSGVDKLSYITISQDVDLDAIETNSSASKVITDFITVTQGVNLDTIETNSDASKVITDFITITQAVDLDTLESDVNTAKTDITNIETKTDFITITQAVDLDDIETNSNASKVVTDWITVTQAVDLDAMEADVSASKAITDTIGGIATYAPSNGATDRTFDANAASGSISATPTQAEVENIRDAVLELADVVATLVADLGLT